MDKHLHIVCFDAPAPPDYGGAIDLFYTIKSLAQAGINITLHYFQYKPERSHQGLEKYCHQIFAYQRKSPWHCLASRLPYIVASRINQELIDRLNKDNHPIILEGVHCCGILPYVQKNRPIVIRLHNNEAGYYQRLAQTETGPLKNFYYLVESNRLERYQQLLPKDGVTYAALSKSDQAIFTEKYGLQNTHFLPCFLPWQQLSMQEGVGKYCLYHGNLSVAENKAVVLWLIQHVFGPTKIPFVVAGKNLSLKLQQKIARHPTVQLVNNPSNDALGELISNAQVHVLPSLNGTGVKLKLLHALFCGRHCITNKEGVAGSGLEELVHLAEDVATFQQTIQNLMQQPFTEKEMQQRKVLLHLYDNIRNAEALITWI